MKRATKGEQAVTIERLREAVQARPFRPFTIVMADGTRVKIQHPEMIAMSPKAERTFVVAYGNEQTAIIDLFLVAAFEFRNGAHRNGRAR